MPEQTFYRHPDLVALQVRHASRLEKIAAEPLAESWANVGASWFLPDKEKTKRPDPDLEPGKEAKATNRRMIRRYLEEAKETGKYAHRSPSPLRPPRPVQEVACLFSPSEQTDGPTSHFIDNLGNEAVSQRGRNVLHGGKQAKEPKRGSLNLAVFEGEIIALAAWINGGLWPKHYPALRKARHAAFMQAVADYGKHAPETKAAYASLQRVCPRKPDRQDRLNLKFLNRKLADMQYTHAHAGKALTASIDTFGERRSRGKAAAEKIKEETAPRAIWQ